MSLIEYSILKEGSGGKMTDTFSPTYLRRQTQNTLPFSKIAPGHERTMEESSELKQIRSLLLAILYCKY